MKKYNWIGMMPFYLLAAIICIGAAILGSENVTTAIQNTPVDRQQTFIIDAGHGGIDGGATSCTGVLESAINLEIALRLNDLMHLLGYDTVMIRRTDTSVYTEGNTIAAQKVSDLKERVRVCNETADAILISIHQNTFSDSRYRGAQVFYAKTDQSKDFAMVLQKGFNDAIHTDVKRECKMAKSVYLLENIECIGVLIECGFLSHAQEEAKLRSEDYQKLLCGVIVSAVSNFVKSNG